MPTNGGIVFRTRPTRPLFIERICSRSERIHSHWSIVFVGVLRKNMKDLI